MQYFEQVFYLYNTFSSYYLAFTLNFEKWMPSKRRADFEMEIPSGTRRKLQMK